MIRQQKPLQRQQNFPIAGVISNMDLLRHVPGLIFHNRIWTQGPFTTMIYTYPWKTKRIRVIILFRPIWLGNKVVQFVTHVP